MHWNNRVCDGKTYSFSEYIREVSCYSSETTDAIGVVTGELNGMKSIHTTKLE